MIVGGDKAVDAVSHMRGARREVGGGGGLGLRRDGRRGRAVQRAMVDTARAAGMRLYGPNTQGLANFGTGALAGFSTMFVEVLPADGPVGIVSQSGGMSAMAYGLLRGRGLGVRHVHATGNEADITVSDLAWAVAHDPDVKLLLLYLGEHRQPRTAGAHRGLCARARPADRRGEGRALESGQKAASSHTGSLANEDRAVDAFFRHHGIWRVRDPHAQALAAEAYLKGWRPEGRRLVIISNSGASCVMGADASEELGLPLAELSPATRADVASRPAGLPRRR